MINSHLELICSYGAPSSNSMFGEPIALPDGRILQAIQSTNGNFDVFIGDTPLKPDLKNRYSVYPSDVPGALYTVEELELLGDGQPGIGIIKILKTIISDPSVFQKKAVKPLAQPAEFYEKYVDIPFGD